ncbi:hypothetical protein VP01_56g3 [Puccinia sorghi]|uniref:Uncharacterized protein n=1 Tax=Puccinia sorghi TaxID=27349 RepID=A0A0L6UKR4_9BASI|nr:hypothetical protein VP01_56g3 [Puccinia sorghi]
MVDLLGFEISAYTGCFGAPEVQTGSQRAMLRYRAGLLTATGEQIVAGPWFIKSYKSPGPFIGWHASSRRLEKRQLKFGNCNTKIKTNQGLFEVEEEPLKSAVKPLNDGVAFLQTLCEALPKVCGQLKNDDVKNCINQAKKLSNGNLGATLADKWNKLGSGRGARRGGSNKRKGGSGTNRKQLNQQGKQKKNN